MPVFGSPPRFFHGYSSISLLPHEVVRSSSLLRDRFVRVQPKQASLRAAWAKCESFAAIHRLRRQRSAPRGGFRACRTNQGQSARATTTAGPVENANRGQFAVTAGEPP